LCDDIDATDYNDVANLFSVLAGNFENVVQYNRDNRAFEVLSLLLRASFLVPVVTFWYKWVFSVKKIIIFSCISSSKNSSVVEMFCFLPT